MVYLEINKKNYNNLIDKLNKHMVNKNDKIFMLIFMEGCGPCNEIRPEWSKLRNILSPNFLKKENIVIVSIDKDVIGKFKNIKPEPMSFPTIRYITNAGNSYETYEDSNVSNKDRKIDSLVEWIKIKTGEKHITKGESSGITYKKRQTSKKTRKQFGGKWSVKYKRSINCNRPKGFSQRQHCKYGRKK